MTNVSNECGQVLNCVLTTGEGAGLDDLCQGIVKRYQDAGEPEPDVIYVDRDCCSETGVCDLQNVCVVMYYLLQAVRARAGKPERRKCFFFLMIYKKQKITKILPIIVLGP